MWKSIGIVCIKSNFLVEVSINFKNKNNFVTIILNNEDLLAYRTHRIANARNKLIEYIKENYRNYEYFIMIIKF